MIEVIMLDTVALAQEIFKAGHKTAEVLRIANINSITAPRKTKDQSVTYFVVPEIY